ncbi:MAG TPA: hypothetical protein VM575_03200 [Nocardioides sp.]|jgi:hypothetical protein|nr:hypothetical protein [Nocardioides sp.]
MSALEATVVEDTTTAPARSAGPRISVELEETVLEIAASERALDDLLGRADRLHASNIQHEPHTCLVCFTQR